jgi:shikimate dehydrogenase
MICGLLGEKLGHSYSPQIHSMLGSYSYDLFEVEPEKLKSFLVNEEFHGLNVTIPYKKAVLPYCDELSNEAEKIGAVNTLIKGSDGKLIGHNSDYFGFKSMLKKSRLDISNQKILVLGTDGASNTVCTVLKEQGANVVTISRNGENNYNNLHLHKDCTVIVNATPIGTYPNTDDTPLDISIFPRLKGVLDLIYNPAHTKLLQQAEANGLVSENGLWMLVAQAKESAEWFTGRSISDDQINTIYQKLRKQMENIILIGMPGCGKSTVGKLLAKQLGREFIDSDAYIVEKARKTIPEIFAEQGEDGFRALETAALAELGKMSGKVIATGGGCITRLENYRCLHQNGVMIWLKRSINDLSKKGRPLSQSQDLQKMYEIRKPLYETFANFTVKVGPTPDHTVASILEALSMEVTA